MSEIVFLCLEEVGEQRAGGVHAARKLSDTEAFERGHVKVVEKGLSADCVTEISRIHR